MKRPIGSHAPFRHCLALVAIALAPALSAAQTGPANLPPDVLAVITKQYVAPDMETRYLDGAVDLNGDGKNELIVHVVGGTACGTGGCPTLVFTPAGAGYRLVATVTVSNPPIRASAARTQGWRDLIVRVSGGGGRPHDAELAFDGKSYPSNPTVAGPRVKAAAATGGDVVIEAFDSLEAAKPLSKGGAAAARAPAATAPATAKPSPAPGPSFDCAKATFPAEKAVCGDPGLAALDRTLGAAYTKAMANWPDEYKAEQRTAQRAWIAKRNACGKASDAKACLEEVYRQRLIEVQITSGQLEAPRPVGFVCTGQENQPFTMAFYNQTEPKSAVMTLGSRQVILFAAPSGSGSRYNGPNAEFWEHQGEAAVTWGKDKFTCNAR